MRFSNAFALATLMTAAQACRYSFRLYGLENPELPGVYFAGGFYNENSGDGCDIELGREEYLEGDTFEMECDDGWHGTVDRPGQEVRVALPAGGGTLVIPLDWDSNDSGNLIGALLSIDGSFGC